MLERWSSCQTLLEPPIPALEHMPPLFRPHVEQRHGFREALIEKEPLGVTPTALRKLPALDEFRNFCFSPHNHVEYTLSDIEKPSVT